MNAKTRAAPGASDACSAPTGAERRRGTVEGDLCTLFLCDSSSLREHISFLEREKTAMKILKEEDYIVSSWSGGKTTEIQIRPEGAKYADRDFLWRLSSASVDLLESDFTLLPDYDRLITPLEGSMQLEHFKEDAEGGQKSRTEPVQLAPFEIHAFDGADSTHSKGKCTDFNLMLRKGRCKGTLTPILYDPDRNMTEEYTPEPGTEALLVYCVRGSTVMMVSGSLVQLVARETLLLEKEEVSALKIVLSEGSAVIAAAISSL